jgi:hypothetical protein
LGIVFGSSESPFEDDQVFAMYEFFHSVLLSRGRSFSFVTSARSPASQGLGCRDVDVVAAAKLERPDGMI